MSSITANHVFCVDVFFDSPGSVGILCPLEDYDKLASEGANSTSVIGVPFVLLPFGLTLVRPTATGYPSPWWEEEGPISTDTGLVLYRIAMFLCERRFCSI